MSHFVKPEDLDSDDELTEEEKFLLQLDKVKSKISHIWKPVRSINNQKVKEVSIKDLDSNPTPF